MKVTFEDKKIKIRRKEGVVIVLDSGVPFDLFEVVKNQARDMDIPFRIGALSNDKEINEDAIENLGQILKNRGRFITPLIEGLFKQLAGKECDLILLHSGKVYDLDDYKSELSSKFGRILTKDVNENQNLTTAEWKTLFESAVFNFSIGNIELFLNSAVPFKGDDDFEILLDVSKRQFILKKSASKAKKMDIHLVTRGKTENANIEIKVNNLSFSGKIKNNTNFIAPQWKYLSEADKQVFMTHLKEYKKTNFYMKCPLCKEKHNFEKPFFCGKQSGDILSGQFTQGALILKDISIYPSRFVLFHADGNNVKYLTSEKEGLEFEDLSGCTNNIVNRFLMLKSIITS